MDDREKERKQSIILR